MKVTLTTEPVDSEGAYGWVEAEGTDYESALEAARARVPEGHRLVAIRTDR